jgi:nitrogen fixation protein FixH
MIKRAVLALSIVLLAGLTACSGTATPPAFTQQAGPWSATLKVEPYPPEAMKAVMLELAVTDEAGQPVSGAAVAFDLTMPEMQMPVNRPQVAEQGDGIYQAAAMLTMAGQWRFAASVSSADHSETFAFDLKTR